MKNLMIILAGFGLASLIGCSTNATSTNSRGNQTAATNSVTLSAQGAAIQDVILRMSKASSGPEQVAEARELFNLRGSYQTPYFPDEKIPDFVPYDSKGSWVDWSKGSDLNTIQYFRVQSPILGLDVSVTVLTGEVITILQNMTFGPR